MAFRNNIKLLTLFLYGVISTVISFSQVADIKKGTVVPSANNFSYPQSVFIDPVSGHIWVSDFDNNRILRFDVSSLMRVKKNEAVINPGNYLLHQNYPNPFNPSTHISFSVPTSQKVVIEVSNIIGQKIATLFDRIALPNIKYTVEFDGKNIPSGIYFYFMQSSHGIIVKRMCFLK